MSGGIATATIDDLIRLAQGSPPEPVVEGLIYHGNVLLLHGTEESFKSVFITQLGESLATGTPFLRRWAVPRGRRVGLLATELDRFGFGQRLVQMFPDGSPQDFVVFDALEQFRKRNTTDERVHLVLTWAREQGLEVLLIDVASDLIRGRNSNPNDEIQVGRLFEQLRDMGLPMIGLIRHDRKRDVNDIHLHANEQIRGSGEWKEDPEVLLALTRPDRRTHEVHLSVGKNRYGSKPPDLTLWFDASCFRLTPLPPIIAILEPGPLPRPAVLEQCRLRFSLSQRATDQMLGEHKSRLRETRHGHQKEFEIDLDAVAEQVTRAEDSGDDLPEWSRLLLSSGTRSGGVASRES